MCTPSLSDLVLTSGGLEGGGDEAADLGEDGAAFGFGAGAVGEVGGDEDGWPVGRPEDGDVVGGGFAVAAGFVGGAPEGREIGAEAGFAVLVFDHPAGELGAGGGGEDWIGDWIAVWA